MVTNELITYVKNSLIKGVETDAIKDSLLKTGWGIDDINQVIRIVSTGSINPQISCAENTRMPYSQNPVMPPGGSEPAGAKAENGNINKSVSLVGVSLISGLWYANILTGRVKSSSFWPILIISLLFTLIPSITVYTKIFPIINNFSQKSQEIINGTIPDGAEVTINKGTASSNLNEPFYLSIKQSDLSYIFGDQSVSKQGVSKIRLLTIDTQAQAENFERYQSLSLLTRNSLVYYRDGKINIQPLRDMKDLKITKLTVLDYVNKVKPDSSLGKLINIFILFTPLFILVSNILSVSFGILILSVIVLFFSKINDLELELSKIFKFCAFISLIPTLLIYFCRFIIPVPQIISSSLILACAYSGIVVYRKNMKIVMNFNVLDSLNI